MAVVSFPDPRENRSGSIEEEVKNLKDAYFMLRKKLSFLLGGALDSENVVEAASVIADWVYAGTIVADQINGGTITGVTINVTTNARVGQNLYLGNQSSLNDTKNIYFNDYMYLAAKADSGWVIEFGCGVLEFIGVTRGAWGFSAASVSGLDSSGWAKTATIQDWVTQNFVHK
jgi:hypothetical protein